jgi:hypothetical protein
MSIRLGVTAVRSAVAMLAIAAIAMAVLHGAIPHHPTPAGCHDCETLASPALLPPPEFVARPEAPLAVLPGRAAPRPTDGPSVRLRPTRAPPSPTAA